MPDLFPHIPYVHARHIPCKEHPDVGMELRFPHHWSKVEVLVALKGIVDEIMPDDNKFKPWEAPANEDKPE